MYRTDTSRSHQWLKNRSTGPRLIRSRQSADRPLGGPRNAALQSATIDEDHRMKTRKNMPHDASYKALFGFPRLLRDLLCEFVAQQIEGGVEWIKSLDFSTLQPLPTEQIHRDFRLRQCDMVWRIRFRDADAGEEWLHLLVILEFQSEVVWWMAVRVQEYAVGLYWSLKRGQKPREGDRLPPVLAVVIYNGKGRWRAARSMAELVGTRARPAGARVPREAAFTGEQYVLVDLGAYKREELPAENAVSLVAAGERIRGVADCEQVVQRIWRLLPAEDQRELRETFLGWLRQLMLRTGVDLEFLEDTAKMEQNGREWRIADHAGGALSGSVRCVSGRGSARRPAAGSGARAAARSGARAAARTTVAGLLGPEEVRHRIDRTSRRALGRNQRSGPVAERGRVDRRLRSRQRVPRAAPEYGRGLARTGIDR